MSSADTLAVGALRGAPAAAQPWRLWKTGVAAAALWAAVGAVTLRWPNVEVGFTSWGYTREFGVAALVLAALLLLAAVAGAAHRRPVRALHRAGPWLLALAVAVGLWEVATAK
ncbi:ABC transporter permease, partial [Achromobacter xylosoxidans]|nr:ABC transporter permease [Achromobacter xylosoxidans]